MLVSKAHLLRGDNVIPTTVSELDHIVMDAKLKRYDEFAHDAVEQIIAWFQEYPEELIAIARGRHVTGHLLYGDRNYIDWDTDRLRKEASEEVADAINYYVEILQRKKYGERLGT